MFFNQTPKTIHARKPDHSYQALAMSDASHAEALATARIDIARLEVTVGHLNKGLVDLQESNQQLTAKLDQVLLTLSEARGGWRTLMVVGGAASTVGAAAAAAVTWLLQHWPRG